jgi:hypothetical protein
MLLTDINPGLAEETGSILGGGQRVAISMGTVVVILHPAESLQEPSRVAQHDETSLHCTHLSTSEVVK